MKLCEYNQDIDFLIYIDCDIEHVSNLQSNVLYCTFEEVKMRYKHFQNGKKVVGGNYKEHQLSMYIAHDMVNIKFNHYEFLLNFDIIKKHQKCKQVFVWNNTKSS